MEITELLEMNISDLTALQFMTIIFAYAVMFALLFMTAAAVAELIAKIIKGIVYVVRKDKYKSRDFTVARACKHVAALRRQFKSAETQTEYFLFLNRLSSTILAYEEIGLFPHEYYLKMIRVSSIYDKKFKERLEKEKREQEAQGSGTTDKTGE